VNWFGVDLPAVVAQAGDGLAQDMTLTVVTPGTATPGSYTSGTNPTTASKTARGYVTDYATTEIDGTVVKQGDRLVVLFAASIQDATVPKPADWITVSSTKYRILAVTSDPANAIYRCQARK